MSLLADLLSKIRPSQTTREIPPNLKNIVHTSAKHSAYKKRIILISIFLVASIALGIFIVYFVQSPVWTSNRDIKITEESSIKMMARVDEHAQGNKDKREDKVIESEIPTEFRGVSSQTEMIAKIEKIQPFKKPAERKINTSERDAYLYTARKYEMKKEYSKALSNYRKALEIDKNNFSVMNNIAYILLHLGLVDESIRYSKKAVSIKENYIPALINLGIAYAKLEDITAAETYLKRAFMLEPLNHSVILNLALLYERQKDYIKASQYFLKLSALGNITGSLGLARIYERQGKVEKALKIYKNIYSLNSIDKETRQLIKQRISFLSEKVGSEK